MTEIVDYANQIANRISKYLPYTIVSLGNNFQATDIALSVGKATMTFTSDDYDLISASINDALNPNTDFTISGFYMKNRLTSFEAYPEGAISYYGFACHFELPHKLKKDQTFTLANFTDSSYNIQYKVLRVIDSFSAVIYPLSTVVIETLNTNDLGFLSVTYTEGFNGIQTVTDEGSNQISFEFEDGLYFTSNDINDLDVTKLPYLRDYSENIKVINSETFFANLTSPSNKDYLIIDTGSFSSSEMRSLSNTGDNSYSAYSRTGRFDKKCNIDLLYLLERNIDDSDNQTASGSDIVLKQVKMEDALTSILRQPLDSNDTKYLSSITITNVNIRSNVSEGRVVISYTLNFISSYMDQILLDIDPAETYKIEQIQVGTDQISLG